MGSPVFSEVAASPVNFYLCNCHLFWDPAFNDVKFVQTYELLLQLNNLMNPRAAAADPLRRLQQRAGVCRVGL